MSSTFGRLGLLAVGLVGLVGLGFGHDARADRKVDWSEYLEPPGARPPKLPPPPVASATPAKKAAPTKITKPARAESRAQPKRKPAARKSR